MGLGALVGAVGATALYAAQPAALPKDRSEMEALVRDYILAHPEIVTQAIERAQDGAVARVIATNRTRLETPYPGAVAGNPAGDVTLVEFYDYNCGYCRTAVKDIDRLLAEDKGVRIVFRELPILSAQSEQASRAALSAARAGTFLAFYRAMYAAGRADPATIATVEKKTGTPPPPQVDAAVDRELDANIALARALGVSGTPSFVVGDRLLNGAVGYDRLKQAIAEVRAKKVAG